MTGPLANWRDIRHARWPAAAEAGELLAALGASVTPDARPDAAALARASDVVSSTGTTAAQDWEQSGAMALTGRPAGRPLHSNGRPATLARAATLALELVTGGRVQLDGAALLGARAGRPGLARRGRISANGSARLLPTADGWIAVNLPRRADLELVPALVSRELPEADPTTGTDAADAAWTAVADWARSLGSAEVEQRAARLGLAVGALTERRAAGPPWRLTPLAPAASTPSRRRPVVVNLGSLWAAPLCAHILALAGAEVIDVESVDRPDGSRRADPDFYADLHAGHRRVALELGSARGRGELDDLLHRADVVITASRARALDQLGVTPERYPARDRVWVTITGHGHDADRIGMGDDAAVCGGLVAADDPVAADEQGPLFAGDAIADPLTGGLAALAASAALRAGGGWRVQLALCDVAAYSRRHGGSADGNGPRADQPVGPGPAQN